MPIGDSPFPGQGGRAGRAFQFSGVSAPPPPPGMQTQRIEPHSAPSLNTALGSSVLRVPKEEIRFYVGNGLKKSVNGPAPLCDLLSEAGSLIQLSSPWGYEAQCQAFNPNPWQRRAHM